MAPADRAGEAIVTPAWLEPDGGFGPQGVQLAATADGDGWRLNGVKRHVAFAKAADRLLVLARTADGPSFFLVDPSAPGVDAHAAEDDLVRHAVPGRLRRRAGRRRRVVGTAGDAWATWDAVMHDGIILLAAQAVGGAQYALDITVQYSKDR